ncbi:hypothetical protein MMC07_007162 [Pseudocyphellaria aurata]|nr:hypothetical protein [Pseudocyphellaria aurata]
MGFSDYSLGEVPQAVRDHPDRFIGLPREEIVKNFRNSFDPINLFRLRFDWHEPDFQEYCFRVDDDGTIKVKRVSCTYKDFGDSVHDIWSEAFLNYSMIMVSLFGSTVPDLHAALSQFHLQVLHLSRIYQWKEAILPLVIDAHKHIVTYHPLDPKSWVIPEIFRDTYCTPLSVLGMNPRQSQPKRKRSRSPPSRRIARQPGGRPTNRA